MQQTPYDYLVDSHCHINYLLEQPDTTIQQILQNAYKLNVQKFLCVNVDQSTIAPIRKLIDSHPPIFGSVGLHPVHTKEEPINQTQYFNTTLHPKIIAIGETGLDYYQVNIDKTKQHRAFIEQIELAHTTDLPLIVHTRAAKEDTLELLKKHGNGKVKGVLHCFTEDLDMAEKAIEIGFYISISGIITFKNAKDLQQIVTQLPLEHLLVETDAPYLAPAPYRGKTNQPAYTQYVAKHIAQLKNTTFEQVMHQTTTNFYQLFSKTNP